MRRSASAMMMLGRVEFKESMLHFLLSTFIDSTQAMGLWMLDVSRSKAEVNRSGGLEYRGG